MKLIFSLLFAGIFSIASAQVSKIDIVDFYNWTSSTGNDYEVVFVAEPFEDNYSSGIARVRYQIDGMYKVVEYNITLESGVDEDGYVSVFIFSVDDEFRFIQGGGSYSPDNFILYFDEEGYFVFGSQADNNELNKDEDDMKLADVGAVEYATKDEAKTIIKKFFSSNDPLYDELMMYVGGLDIE